MMILLATFVTSVWGHGMITLPVPRVGADMANAGWCNGTYAQGTCLWFNQGCQPGCPYCTGGNCVDPRKPCCPTVTLPSLPHKLEYRTYMDMKDPKTGMAFNPFVFNPWSSPGKAPIINSCGVAGGFHLIGAAGNGGYAPPNVAQGMLGSDLPKSRATVWTAGGHAEVAWGITANHGGGYQYRLCPADKKPTEECFQSLPLTPVDGYSYIQYGTDVKNRKRINAVRVSEGTTPAGSTWTKNPIPACSGNFGGAQMHGDCKTPQFTPPLPGLFGFGAGRCGSKLPGAQCTAKEETYWLEKFNFNIVDVVKVPEHLSGDYTLSWRWDCEQTPQIWSSCSDITIVQPGNDHDHHDAQNIHLDVSGKVEVELGLSAELAKKIGELQSHGNVADGQQVSKLDTGLKKDAADAVFNISNNLNTLSRVFRQIFGNGNNE